MNFKRFLGLIALVCVLACTLSFVVACDTVADGDETSAETTTEAATTAGTTEPETSEEETTRGKLPHEIIEDQQTTAAGNDKVTYTVTVVDQNGDAVVGALVQMCTILENGETGQCMLPMPTDANGVRTLSWEETDFYATITKVPDGYTTDTTTKHYFDGEVSITVTVTKTDA